MPIYLKIILALPLASTIVFCFYFLLTDSLNRLRPRKPLSEILIWWTWLMVLSGATLLLLCLISERLP